MRKSGLIMFWAVFTIMLAVPVAFAGEIFLNGVNIGSIRNQTFKDIKSIFIDQNGDVHIDAPSYNVKLIDPETSKTPAQAKKIITKKASKGGPNELLQTRYFMATQPSEDGAAQYDFLLKINGVERKTIKAGSPVIIVEISKWLKKGVNKVEILAQKNIEGKRISKNPSDIARMIIGTGHEEGSIVKIDKVISSVKAYASQTTDVSKRFTINAR